MSDIIPIIAGPTAVGKTALSVELAKRIGAEIVSADSRQIYAPFRIGTARPTTAEMAGVTHHLLGELPLDAPYSSGLFADRARTLIPDIQATGARVVVAGGSTLYVEALLNGLSDIPAVDPSIREALNREAEDNGAASLHQELVQVDPVFARSLDPTKTQRIIRGLEVYRGTGQPLSSFHTPPPLPDQVYRLFVLHTDRQELYRRIDERVDSMMASGLMDEVRTAWNEWPDASLNAWRTIGYQELLPVLTGERTLEEGIRLIKRNSRRYAKRQLTWYRRYEDATWLDLSITPVETAADAIAADITAS